MGDLIVSLIPLALGIVMSPLAIMALVAVLLSRRSRVNGVAFLVGWALAVVVALVVASLVFGALEVHELGAPPLWVPVVRLVLGLLLLLGAVFVYRRGHGHVVAMAEASTPTEVVAAAPQLPGWLRAVETFTPARSAILGFGIFILNPVDASCAVLAALDLQLALADSGVILAAGIVFAVIGILPIAVPVIVTLVRGEAADPFLHAARTWISSHTNVLNAALLLVIAALQIEKAVSAFVAY